MNDKTFIIICGTLLILSVFTLGWFGKGEYDDYKNERYLNGIYLSNNISFEQAERTATIRDKKGDWVCINVAYDMPIELAYDTCVHECSHASFSEIFAEKCEDDEVKCKEYLK